MTTEPGSDAPNVSGHGSDTPEVPKSTIEPRSDAPEVPESTTEPGLDVTFTLSQDYAKWFEAKRNCEDQGKRLAVLDTVGKTQRTQENNYRECNIFFISMGLNIW